MRDISDPLRKSEDLVNIVITGEVIFLVAELPQAKKIEVYLGPDKKFMDPLKRSGSSAILTGSGSGSGSTLKILAGPGPGPGPSCGSGSGSV